MASWCWVCHYKVDASYVYYKGEKCHRKCRDLVKRKPHRCPTCYRRFATQEALTEHSIVKHKDNND